MPDSDGLFDVDPDEWSAGSAHSEDRARDSDAAEKPGLLKRMFRWLLVGFVGMPMLCCGGCFFLQYIFKDFELADPRHLNRDAMQFSVQYRIKADRNKPLWDFYFLVGETQDGTRMEQNIAGRLPEEGTFTLVGIGAGEVTDARFPVKLWIDKETRDGSRSRASNVVKASRAP